MKKFEKDGEEKIYIIIKYCTLNFAELKKMEQAEQIRTVLNVMRYKDEDIKSIVYRKYWSNSDEKVWVAKVYDPDYDFGLDEMYSERDFRNSVMNPIREVFGYSVIVDFI